MSAVIGYAPGAYDLFHVGHLNVLRQAREHCDVLVAGVVADEICELTKGVRPFVPLEERLEIVAQHRHRRRGATPRPRTDKLDAWQDVRFHRIFKGDDWRGTAEGPRPRGAARRRRGRGRLLPLHDAHLQHDAAPGGRRRRAATRRRVRCRRSPDDHDRPGRRRVRTSTTGGSRCPPPCPASSPCPSTVATSGRSSRGATPARARAGRSSPGRPSLRPHLRGRTRLTARRARRPAARTSTSEVVLGDGGTGADPASRTRTATRSR